MVASCYHPISSYPCLPDFFGWGVLLSKPVEKGQKEKLPPGGNAQNKGNF
jgi:hypothetical protein